MVVQSRPKDLAIDLKEADWSSMTLMVERSSKDKCLFFLMIVSSLVIKPASHKKNTAKYVKVKSTSVFVTVSSTLFSNGGGI